MITITCDSGCEGGGQVACLPDGSFDVGGAREPTACIATQVANSDFKGYGSIHGVTATVLTVTCEAGFNGGVNGDASPVLKAWERSSGADVHPSVVQRLKSKVLSPSPEWDH